MLINTGNIKTNQEEVRQTESGKRQIASVVRVCVCAYAEIVKIGLFALAIGLFA